MLPIGTGPSNSSQLRELFSEGPNEIEGQANKFVEDLKKMKTRKVGQLDWEDLQKEVKVTLDSVESIVRLHIGLAADKERAVQRGREMLALTRQLRWNFVTLQRSRLAAALRKVLEANFSPIFILLRQLQVSALADRWPDSQSTAKMLHTIYTEGNTPLLLRFLLESSAGDKLDVVTAYYDYAHVKLLEILAQTCSSMRVICNEAMSERFNRFPSLHKMTRVRYNLHSRVIAGTDLALVSSADLRGETYTSHLEAGMAVERTHLDANDFVERAWSGGIPVTNFGVGLCQSPYQTSHILIGLRSLKRSGSPASEIYRDLFDASYGALSLNALAGYVDLDRRRSVVYVNGMAVNEDIRTELTNLYASNYNQYFSILPLQEVVLASERDGRAGELVHNGGDITLLYFSTGVEADIKEKGKKIQYLAKLQNNSVRCVAISLESGKSVFGEKFTPKRRGERYLCLVHPRELVAVSPFMDTNELRRLSIWRYVRESMN